MNLIGQVGLNTTAYKKARVIFFDNSSKAPSLRIYENTVIPVGDEVIETPSGEYLVNYSPDIVIPLFNPLTGEATGNSLPIDELLAIMYSIYAFACTYTPPNYLAGGTEPQTTDL